MVNNPGTWACPYGAYIGLALYGYHPHVSVVSTHENLGKVVLDH